MPVLQAHVDLNIRAKDLAADQYLTTVRMLKASHHSIPGLSHDAWLEAPSIEPPIPPGGPVGDHGDAPTYWFVGASWGGHDDQTQRFLVEGVWENGYDDRYLDEVRSMRHGERIAIKSSYTRKHNLPFDGGGLSHSVMAIKAIGTIIENPGDGRHVRVQWDPSFEPVEWFFYTNRSTVWGLKRGQGRYGDLLIAFAFEGMEQDHAWFLTEPYWRERMRRERRGPVVTPVEEERVGDAAPAEPDLPLPAYGVEDIVNAGAFIDRGMLGRIVSRLRQSKNIILQGPPGVGKTFLAKHIAFAMMGEQAAGRVTRVQFHQATSYEDFVRGLRPRLDGKGGFDLVDGAFLVASEAARVDPEGRPHVLIIEEINRGNPSQILGELLTLLERDKRTPEHAIRLAHARDGEEDFHVPHNLHVIGTMNLADRSLALVDFALRRRFDFFTLEPQFGAAHRAWCIREGMSPEFVDDIVARIAQVNDIIDADRALGKNYRIGHSFLVPNDDLLADGDERGWYRAVVETQIIPLLEEYWFEAPDRVREGRRVLLGDAP